MVIVVSVTDSIFIAVSWNGSVALGYVFVDVLLSTSQVKPIEFAANLILVPGDNVWDPIVNSIIPVTGS